MNAIIKWTLYTAMLVITLASALSMASAATFTDSFNVSGDGNWSLDATFTEDLIEGSIGPNTASGASIYQNFTLTENMNFNESITITADTYTLPGSNVHYNVISFIKEGAWNSQANGVFFWPTYDIDDDNNNHEMRIACLGDCSCTLVDYNNTLTNDGFYSSTINIDLLTGNVTMTRNDSAQLSTIVSGCDFQDYYLNLFFRSSYDVTEFWDFSITDNNLVCTPNWTCSGYAACNTSDLQACNAVTDQNTCGDIYSGDYSEFTPQACDYCTPNWSCIGYGICLINDTRLCNQTNDSNSCFAQTGLPSDQYNGTYTEFNVTACDYCTPNWGCIGYGICLINDTRLCNETNDSNSCFAQTGLPSDQYNGTYTEFNVTACDYCTPSWTCIGYAACAVNDTRTCNSTNDTNSCYATTGLVSDQYSGTYTEFNTTLCDYCLPNWSCSLFGACNISNLKPCLSTADNNVCYSLTGLPSDQFNESLSAYEGVCVYTPPQTGGGGAYSTYVAPLATRAADVTSQTVTTTTGWWDGLPDKEKQIYILIFSGFAIAFLLRGKIL